MLILGDVGCYELLFESQLPRPGEKTWLFGPGWPEVGWLNVCRGAPHLYLSDQVSRRQEAPLYRNTACQLAPLFGLDQRGR